MISAEEIAKWQAYQKRTANGKPRPLLTEALKFVHEKKSALDLGAGNLNDSQFLLTQGFAEVCAVDFTPQFQELKVPTGTKFTYQQVRFEQYQFPTEYFDLISAQYALPFMKREDLERVWKGIGQALKPGGIFTGQLFGVHDDWSSDSDMTFHESSEITQMVGGFHTHKCEEREYTETEERAKHWHLFNLILEKI